MLDIKFIRENPEVVKEAAKNKNVKVDVDRLLVLDSEVVKLKQELDELRQKRNENAEGMKGGKPSDEQIEAGKNIKDQISELEAKLNPLDAELTELINGVPNLIAEDVPIGVEGEGSVVSEFGERKTFGKDHIEIGEKKGWIDFESGAKVAGAKFYYLKGDLALLENAIYQFALKKVVEKGFELVAVPNMVNSRTVTGTGFAPRTSEQSDEYHIEGEDLTLIGTAEVSLTGLHADQVFDEKDLPIMYASYSPCYRKEAGAYGKHNKGLFRVHQFNKLEMYVFGLPEIEDSVKLHELIRGVEEEIWREIGIPYRLINIPSGDLGAPAYKKYDIEYWSPADSEYRELTSCSNCTDFQARNLNIRVKRADGKIEFVHTLNGTAVSLARSLVAILENFQTEEGDVIVPEVLRPYMGGREKI